MTFCTAFSDEEISDIALEQWFLNLVLGTTLCVFLFFVCLPYLTHLIQIISSLGETPWTELSVSDNRHTKCAGPELTTALEFSQTIYLSRKHYIAFYLSEQLSLQMLCFSRNIRLVSVCNNIQFLRTLSFISASLSKTLNRPLLKQKSSYFHVEICHGSNPSIEIFF